MGRLGFARARNPVCGGCRKGPPAESPQSVWPGRREPDAPTPGRARARLRAAELEDAAARGTRYWSRPGRSTRLSRAKHLGVIIVVVFDFAHQFQNAKLFAML